MKVFHKECLRVRRFTLVELLAAMGVFSILLVVSMRLFSGAQTIWVRSEQKSNAFSDARTAMEFVASRLQTVAYSAEVPFQLDGLTSAGNAGYYSTVYFPTVMPMERKDSSGKEIDKEKLRFLQFKLITDSHDTACGTLQLRIYSDKGNRKFPYLLPPYEGNRYYSSHSAALSAVKSNCDGVAGSDNVAIIENVTSFKLIPFYISASGKTEKIVRYTSSTSDPKNQTTTPPYVLEIELSLMDSKDNFKRWLDANTEGKKDLEREFGYTFRRAVLLGDRRD